jgi:hypothetical protein
MAAEPACFRPGSATQPRYRLLNGVHRSLGGLSVKQPIDQPVRGYELVGVDHQEREQGALTFATDTNLRSVAPRLHGSQNAELQRPRRARHGRDITRLIGR